MPRKSRLAIRLAAAGRIGNEAQGLGVGSRAEAPEIESDTEYELDSDSSFPSPPQKRVEWPSHQLQYQLKLWKFRTTYFLDRRRPSRTHLIK